MNLSPVPTTDTRKKGGSSSSHSPDLKAILQEIGITHPEAVSTKQASAYLTRVMGVPTATGSLEAYRCQSRGPRYKKIGSRVFYTVSWLNEYASGLEVKIFDPQGR
jgi:hypothetical protein